MFRRIIPPLIALSIFALIIKITPYSLSQEKVEEITSFITLQDKSPVLILYRKAETPQDIVPVRCEGALPITYTSVPSLRNLPTRERKEKFIHLLLPSVLIANLEVERIRQKVLEIYLKMKEKKKPTQAEMIFLKKIMDRCRSDSIEEVLEKAHPVPPSVLIAQSAIETGWGTSRFFSEGNNLFGMWTFKKEGAIKARSSEAYLRRYKSVLDSVRGYLYTVNVGWAYRDFREKRLTERDPLSLTEHLSFYSVERERYVRKVQRIIKENGLERFDRCYIDPSFIR